MPKPSRDYQVVVEYDSSEFNRLVKLDSTDLTGAQRNHLAKELSEILINLSSHSGRRIQDCALLDPHCFVFETKSGWNDAKIDLFYLATVTNMDIDEDYAESVTTERASDHELAYEEP